MFKRGEHVSQFRLFKKYPPGYSSIFFMEVLGNFTFYGLKSLIVLYVIDQFSFDKEYAFHSFAVFMTLSYATSIVGGFLADKCLGVKHSITIGAVLIALGSLALVIPYEDIYFISLGLLVIGFGFFKPNIISSVGCLFPDNNDIRKDAAFTTFYVGMNMGGFIAPILCGIVSELYGWHYAFLLVGASMAIGAFVFYVRFEYNSRHWNPPPETFKEYSHKEFLKGSIYWAPVLLFVGVLLCYLFFSHIEYAHGLMVSILLLSGVYFVRIFTKCNTEERRNLLTILVCMLFFSVFCALFEQVGSSLIVFFDKSVDKTLLGWTLPTSTLLSLSPLFILLFGPLHVFVLNHMEKARVISVFIKYAIGFLLVSLSFVTLSISAYSYHNGFIPMGWVAFAMFVQTLGELWIVPTGFSMISRLSPKRYTGVMMGLWLLSIAFGHYIAGILARLSVGVSAEALLTDRGHYAEFFLDMALIPLIASIILLGKPLILLIKRTPIAETTK